MLDRRHFCLSLSSVPVSLALGSPEAQPMPWDGPASVAKVFLSAPQVHWPRPDVDLDKDIAEVNARLTEFERRHTEEVRFTGGDVLRKNEEAAPWVKRQGDIDAVLIIPLSEPMAALRPLLDALTVPALYFSRPYAGHQWSSIAGLRRSGKMVDVVASSSYGDLDPYARVFRTIHHLRHSTVLVGAADPRGRQELGNEYSRRFGTGMKFLGYEDLTAAFNAADAGKADAAADDFTRRALRVVEPSAKEIRDGLRFYLAMADMLKRERANAVTVDCFGGLLAGRMPAYPCIAWSRLNDRGFYGVCEGDIDSTLTQMLVTSYSRMPGFVSDPVVDLSRNEVVHAHCVSATKMKGFDAPASPYIIRDHLETKEGAVLQVLMPAGEVVTVGRFAGPKKFLISTAEVTGNVDSDRGCRTQIRTRVSDARKMLDSYSSGLHRVIFYGDHVQAIERMGRLMGFEVVHEV